MSVQASAREGEQQSTNVLIQRLRGKMSADDFAIVDEYGSNVMQVLAAEAQLEKRRRQQKSSKKGGKKKKKGVTVDDSDGAAASTGPDELELDRAIMRDLHSKTDDLKSLVERIAK